MCCNIRLQTKAETDQVVDGETHMKEAHLARAKNKALCPSIGISGGGMFRSEVPGLLVLATEHQVAVQVRAAG